MPRTFLIIDGDNLLHAAGLGRRTATPRKLDSLRRQLLKQLRTSLAESVMQDLTVVFDGTQSESLLQEFPTIRFSGPKTDADSVIDQLLRSHSSPRQVVVVSSDHQVQKSASRRDARFLDSEQFWRQFESSNAAPRSEPPVHQTAEFPDRLLPEDRDHFLSIDVHEIEQAERKQTRREK